MLAILENQYQQRRAQREQRKRAQTTAFRAAGLLPAAVVSLKGLHIVRIAGKSFSKIAVVVWRGGNLQWFVDASAVG